MLVSVQQPIRCECSTESDHAVRVGVFGRGKKSGWREAGHGAQKFGVWDEKHTGASPIISRQIAVWTEIALAAIAV